MHIISVASILPDHFTQTPGEKHYFTVRTLNVVHTLVIFFLRDNCISRRKSPGTASGERGFSPGGF